MSFKSKAYIVCWIFVLAFLIPSIFLMRKNRMEYSTSEYWVAKDYHHVYETYSGRIVDVIEENETCKIDGDVIIVSSDACGKWGYTIGYVLNLFSGVNAIFLIVIPIKEYIESRKG